MRLAGLTPRDTLRPLIDTAARTRRLLDFLGGMVLFTGRALSALPMALTRYAGEVRTHIGELTLGRGFFVTFTGTLGVVLVESLFVGIEVGVQGFQGLKGLGIAPLTGFVSAYANTREVAPLVAAVAITAQVGCKFTAQIGAQRISEEIDALESMAVQPLPYLVSTRIVAAFTAVVPLYLTGLLGSYIATRLTVGIFYQQSLGTYDHYFQYFLHPIDVVYSVLKVLAFTAFIVVIHTYYGYTAAGGPEGVGVAAARAVRATTVMIAIVDIALTMLFWGLHSVRLGGG